MRVCARGGEGGRGQKPARGWWAFGKTLSSLAGRATDLLRPTGGQRWRGTRGRRMQLDAKIGGRSKERG